MTFTMARQILVEMAESFDVEPLRYSGGDRLDHRAFLRLEEDLVKAGFSWETLDAEELLAALRATSEPLLDGLASYLLPLPGCSISGASPRSLGARPAWHAGAAPSG
jgi:hypothetical protein